MLNTFQYFLLFSFVSGAGRIINVLEGVFEEIMDLPLIASYLRVNLLLNFTSYYRQIWRPDYPMNVIVPSIVGGLNEMKRNSIIVVMLITDL